MPFKTVGLMFSGNGDLPVSAVSEISAAAEQKGFSGLWFGETTIRDAGVLSCLAISATKKVEVGTSIVNVYTRSPGQLAMLAATLNELSDGRFTLGLGASTPTIVSGWHGVPYEKPLLKVEETVKLLRLYFSGERFDYKGYFNSPSNARLRVKGTPRIALAALNEKMIGLASRLADRVILNLYPSSMIPEVLRIRKEANPSSHARLSVMLYAYVLGESDKGLQASKELIAFYASSEAYSRLFARAGYAEEAKRAYDAWRLKDRELVRKSITDEMVQTLMVYGDINTLRERVMAYHDAGVDDVLISPCPTGNYVENIRHIVEHYF
ncbi:MAG: LLM class flavin-dependent oxidoreductase [Thermoprotei archaeon]